MSQLPNTRLLMLQLTTSAYAERPGQIRSKMTLTIGRQGGMPVREILKQAQSVCATASSEVCLPRSIEDAARRAIDLRRKFSVGFPCPATSNDDTHLFFVSILEQAVNLLGKQ